MKIGFIALAMLFSCSALAGAMVAIPFDDLFGAGDEENADNVVDPNDDLIEEQRATVEANPNDLEAVLLLANILGNSDRLDEAIPYYETAVDLAPNDASVRLDFARALADGQLRQDAELQFRKVLELQPDSQEALYYLAELYRNWEPPRAEEAAALYEKSVAVDPNSFIGGQARNQLNSISGTPSPQATPASPDGDGTDG